MKKALLAVMSLIMTVTSSAQQYVYPLNPEYTESHNIYYGLRLGLTLSTVNSDDDELDGGGVRPGLNVGAVIGFQLSQAAPVYLETGLYYTEKGGKGYYEGRKFTYDLDYLELPIIAKYKFGLDGFSMQPFLGGYMAVGVGGKVKDYGTSADDRVVYSSFSSKFFKRFDGGIRIGCGIEYQMIYADIAYDFGLYNICHDDFDSSHTGCFYINIGVDF